MTANNSVAWVCQQCGQSSPLETSECDECGSVDVEKETRASAAEKSDTSSPGRRLAWYAAGAVATLLLLTLGFVAFLAGFGAL